MAIANLKDIKMKRFAYGQKNYFMIMKKAMRKPLFA